ncbi:PIR Superfamily Protein [Plasmodium ovale curtisi]|uniref:PIR Superfamily Protein n=1 Tax=Plasmodium ovale curtisi TaxID=864141 RepID=A0A1A8WH25_PLAOA|nr:PIR Superfamily Protein [Plasmodium ovale curtisi]
MSSQVDTTDFYKLFRSSSKELFSEKFYEAMNSESSNLSKYDHHCNQIYVRLHKDQMIIICKKFLRYLEYCKLWNNEYYRYDITTLLNYWLYDKLTDIYGANNTDKISSAFASLQCMWGYVDSYKQNDPHNQKCKPILKMVNHNDWDKRKKLYDYYVDHDILFGLAKSIDDDCEYYKQIEEKKSLYVNFDEQCLLENYICLDFYDKCMPYKPYNVLSKLSCHEKNAQEHADSKIAEIPDAMKHTLARLATGFEVEVTLQNSQIHTKVGYSVLGVAPVLLTATALYKYTPIGPWIRKLSGNTNSVSDIEEFSSYTQESSDMFSDNSTNYISYQPT